MRKLYANYVHVLAAMGVANEGLGTAVSTRK